MNEKRYHGTPGSLHTPQRVARLEIGRVVALCLESLRVSTVLDVGTGSGLFAEAFAKRVQAVTGIDVAKDMIEQARQRVAGVAFQQAPMELLPFPNDAFDLVFFGQALHESNDLTQTLAEAHRCARLRIAALEWPYKEEPVGPPLAHRLHADQIITIAKQLGFAKTEIIPMHSMVLYRLTL